MSVWQQVRAHPTTCDCVWQPAAGGSCCRRQQLAAQHRGQSPAGQQVADAEASKHCEACTGWPTPGRPPARCTAPALAALLAASCAAARAASCCCSAACRGPGHESSRLLPAPACTPPRCPSGAAVQQPQSHHCSCLHQEAEALLAAADACSAGSVLATSSSGWGEP